MVKIVKLNNQTDQLIAQLKNHDRKVQYDFYKKHSPKLLSVIRMYISDIHYAEEVLSNSFVKIFKKIDSFNGPSVAIHNWVRTIAVREAINFLRKKKDIAYPSDQLEDKHTDGSNPINDENNLAYLQEKIDKLPYGYKMVFMLYVIEGYSHKAIAGELGINEGTSKSQLYKARKMIKQLLTKDDYANG